MAQVIKVGDTVESIFGSEHRGEVIEVSAFKDGIPFYHVRRFTDDYLWYGWPATVIKIEDEEEW